MRIGDVALPPSTWSVPDCEPRRPILMQSPSASTFDGSPSTQWSNFSPRSAHHFKKLDGAVDGDVLFVAGDQERDRTPWARPFRRDIAARRRRCRRYRLSCRPRRGHRRKPSFTSPENAPSVHAVSSPGGTTSVCPAKVMCGALVADAGVEIIDVGRAGLAEGDACGTSKPASFSRRSRTPSAPASAGGDADGQRMRSRAKCRNGVGS